MKIGREMEGERKGRKEWCVQGGGNDSASLLSFFYTVTWDGLDYVNLEQLITYNTLDNEHRTHECSETFTTNEVR